MGKQVIPAVVILGVFSVSFSNLGEEQFDIVSSMASLQQDSFISRTETRSSMLSSDFSMC